MFCPLIRMVPFVGLSIVAIKLSSVVFPEPDAPTTEIIPETEGLCKMQA